jgi:hypothetical protein
MQRLMEGGEQEVAETTEAEKADRVRGLGFTASRTT